MNVRRIIRRYPAELVHKSWLCEMLAGIPHCPCPGTCGRLCACECHVL